jgi:hypothetical protein
MRTVYEAEERVRVGTIEELLKGDEYDAYRAGGSRLILGLDCTDHPTRPSYYYIIPGA